jgi:hypothetical protein
MADISDDSENPDAAVLVLGLSSAGGREHLVARGGCWIDLQSSISGRERIVRVIYS